MPKLKKERKMPKSNKREKIAKIEKRENWWKIERRKMGNCREKTLGREKMLKIGGEKQKKSGEIPEKNL